MERKIAIGLCGLTKAGKNYVAEILSSPEFGGFRVYDLTERVLIPVAQVRGEPQDRDGLRMLLTKLDNVANEILYAQVYLDGAHRIVLPNVRMLSAIDFWGKRSEYEFHLGYVDASPETRYERYVKMRRDIDPPAPSPEVFKRTVDDRDLNVNELSRIIDKRRFDYVIDNDGDSKEHLKAQIRDFLAHTVKLD